MTTENITKTITDLDRAYYDNIDSCALMAVDRFIKNGQPEHARYLMKKMFDLASSQIRLYSGHLVRNVDEKDVYADADLIESMKAFLRMETSPKLHIALQHDIDGDISSHPFFIAIDELKDAGELKASVEVRKIDSDVENHFMVMDDNAYRLERDHDPCNAIANFNDKKTAKQITSFFDTVFPMGTEVYQA